MSNYKSALKLNGDRQFSPTPEAIARDSKLDSSDMKNNPKQNISYKFTWLRSVCTACLAGAIAVSCTSLPDRPEFNAPQSRSPDVPIQASPANAISPIISQASQPQVCKITMAKVADPKPPTNVRSSPEVVDNNIVGKLDNGSLVSVQSEKNGWLEISNPVTGWVDKTVMQSDCNEKTQRVSFPSNATSTSISGRFIGTGSHEYLLKATKGQTMTVTVQEGPLPFIFSPNDSNRQKDLTGGGSYTGKKSWTGQLPETGDYIMQLDSNRSGYEYKFSVEAK